MDNTLLHSECCGDCHIAWRNRQYRNKCLMHVKNCQPGNNPNSHKTGCAEETVEQTRIKYIAESTTLLLLLLYTEKQVTGQTVTNDTAYVTVSQAAVETRHERTMNVNHRTLAIQNQT